MSRFDVEAIAQRWGCTPHDVGVRIAQALAAWEKKPIPETDEMVVFPSTEQAKMAKRFVTIGVSEDDRLAILDKNHNVLAWLDREV